MRALTHGVSVGGVNPRKSGGENSCLHGSKRENAALTAMHQRIAPPPRQGCSSPGCIRPQPATAEISLIFGLRRPDVLSLGDAGLQRAARLLFGDDATLERMGQPGPGRGYARDS
jgi:hypothetical protein